VSDGGKGKTKSRGICVFLYHIFKTVNSFLNWDKKIFKTVNSILSRDKLFFQNVGR
jgi:hypothetical protein